MDTAPTAIIDACVLYSASVRDFVVRLAVVGKDMMEGHPL